MRSLSDRIAQSALTALLLVGCSDGAPPTQPVSTAPTTPERTPRVATNVIPTVAGTPIVACYIPGKALVYRIKVAGAPEACAKTDVEFTIDQGVPGPQGPIGPQGPQGEAGPQGPGGPIGGVTYHTAGVTLPPDGQFRATCPAGKSVLHFGWEIPAGSTALSTQIWRNRPTFGVNQIDWIFGAAAGTAYNFYYTCAVATAPTLG